MDVDSEVMKLQLEIGMGYDIRYGRHKEMDSYFDGIENKTWGIVLNLSVSLDKPIHFDTSVSLFSTLSSESVETNALSK